jgi:hypothetical protein
MLRTLLQRFGVGVLAATGLSLLALSVAGVAGLQDRLDAATRPTPAPAPTAPVRDCPHEHPQEAPAEL